MLASTVQDKYALAQLVCIVLEHFLVHCPFDASFDWLFVILDGQELLLLLLYFG